MGSPRKREETQQEAHQQQQQQREKMCGPPCFRSVCGMPLQKAVYIIGLIELIITVIVTIANVVKYSQFVNEEDCQGKDVCIGPIIKYCVFDAFCSILCSVLLFIGARMRHRCLLIFWILVTLGCSIKYLYVFVVSDWTSLEDWVSISYLLFYTSVTLVVVAFTKECGTTTSGGVVHDYGSSPRRAPPQTHHRHRQWRPGIAGTRRQGRSPC